MTKSVYNLSKVTEYLQVLKTSCVQRSQRNFKVQTAAKAFSSYLYTIIIIIFIILCFKKFKNVWQKFD